MTPVIEGWDSGYYGGGKDLGQAAAAAVVGGTTSVITGGKFANGAITAAYANLYNAQRGAQKGNGSLNAVFDKTTGKITVTDTVTGKTVILPAFSGKSGSYAAAPNGKYIISHFPWLKDDYYALVHVDGVIDDFVDGTPSNYDPSQTMGHIRLHLGLVSHACVTLPVDTSQWNSVESLLTNAQQGNPLSIGGESFPTFGELTVQGSGHGSTP